MMLPNKHLLEILELIKVYFPNVGRVSSYCLPRNVKHKSVDDLRSLRKVGLTLVYIGCESGSNAVMNSLDKGKTFALSLDALSKLQTVGPLKRSIMILVGVWSTRTNME
jgi:radical SAM superfamily enzyme YgiQ (UPF0313 family)